MGIVPYTSELQIPYTSMKVKEEIDTLLSSGQAQEARQKLRQFRRNAEENGRQTDLAWSYRKEAQCDFLENRLEPAIEHAFTAAEYARQSKDAGEQANAYNALGILYGQKGELKQAVEHLKHSYQLHTEAGTGRGATVLNNIGQIYELMDEYQRALEYFQHALSSVRERQDTPHLLGTILGNVGRALTKLGQHEEAISALQESIATFERYGFEVPRAHALAKFADALVAREDGPESDSKAEAEALYREAIQTNTAGNEQSWHEELQGSLGSLLVSEGRYEEAKPLLEAAIEGVRAQRISAESEADWRSRYSEVLERSGDLSGALEQQRLANRALRDNYRQKLENRLHEALAVVELRRLETENVDLAHKAQHDPLTALYNRRAFTSRLHEEIARARRYGRDLSLVMLDLDHFKAVNDTIGHIGGDQVLIGTAELLSSRSRKSDTVARYGGEELAIIMPETTPEKAYAFCEKLRSSIEGMNWSAFGINASITASMGISGMRQDDSFETLLERADAMLYRAKDAGRNTVMVDEPA